MPFVPSVLVTTSVPAPKTGPSKWLHCPGFSILAAYGVRVTKNRDGFRTARDQTWKHMLMQNHNKSIYLILFVSIC